MENMKLDHIGLIVSDIKTSLDWYQNMLGFELKEHFSGYGMDFYYLEKNGTVYEIRENPGMHPAHMGKVDHMAFTSEDIKADYEYFKNKGARFATNGIGHLEFIGPNGVDFFMIMSDTDEIIEFCKRR